MAQLADFISRIFSTGRTQGLSGGAEMVLDADPAAAFYVSRLRKHSAEGDYVDDPSQLWSTMSFGNRRGGLRAHIAAERGEGVASFTDVLVVVSQADARRASAISGEAWTERAARVLGELFTEFCVTEKFELLYGTRPLRFRLVADGGKEMLSQSFGLEAGEFITGLLPNLYVGPAPRSRPVLAVHLNLPGVWEGYREVGRLYSDQIVFTLGRHWLDNFAHPALREPGLYRLQQYPDGSLVHVISPELQDRYCVRNDQTEAGPSVLTIAELSGRPVAFLVLAVIESMTVELPPMAFAQQQAKTAAQKGTPVQAEPTQSFLDAPVSMGATQGLSNRQKTIVPDAFDTRILTLHERGALLQKVHFSNFMEGYDVYLGPKAQVATSATSPKATIQVRFGRVSLVGREPGVRVDGKPLDPGQQVVLKGNVSIEVDGVRVEYRDLSGVKADGWPYLAELRRPGAGTYLDFGAVFQIGRDRRSKVRLPDEPHNENIAWLPSVGGGATIRSRTGDIPKSRFYTDSIMVASTHAEVDLAGEPMLRSLARHCYTYVRRGNELIALFPREGAGGRHEVAVLPNDELLVGNCLFQVAYPPVGSASPASMPPAEVPRFNAEVLASLVDVPGVGNTAAGVAAAPPTPAPGPSAELLADARNLAAAAVSGPFVRSLATVDPVGPAALGDAGPAPRPVRDSRPSITPVGKAKRPVTAADATQVDDVPTPERLGGAAPPPVQLAAADLQSAIHAVGSLPKVPPATPPPTPPATPKAAAPAPLRSPEPEPARPPPPMLLDEADAELVVSVEEQQWQHELSRPARLVQAGWSVHGEYTIGNHRDNDMVVPEVKAFSDQSFLTLDYVRVYARGRKGRIDLVQEGEASVIVAEQRVRSTENVREARVEIVRRDANLDPDFDIVLRFVEGADLPDPRAQLLAVDVSDRLVAALFTLGLPMRAERALKLGPIRATVRYDGAQLVVSDYLVTYRTGANGFVPFFYKEGQRPWRTFPEDGTAVTLSPGDQVLAGMCVYRFEVA